MNIKNKGDLQELEMRIGMALGRFDLPQVLMALELLQDEFESFVIAGMTLFAVRYASPRITRSEAIEQLERDQLAPLAHLEKMYLLADPVSFEPPVQDVFHGSTIIPIILRTVGNQFVYDVSFFGQYARSLKLFRDIPIQLKSRAGIPVFDLEDSFQKINKVPVSQFIDIGFTAYAAAIGRKRFTGDYFAEARRLGISLPNDDDVTAVLDQLAADKFQLNDMYERFAQRDRRYAAYDFNPIVVHPVIRPWPKHADTSLIDDRLIAPLPELILSRISEGFYQQMFFHYRNDFSDFFGHVFEAYVGEILNHAFPGAVILSEQDIRRTYRESRGKVTDWVVIEGDAALFFECKATGLSRKALAMGDQSAIDYSLSQVIDGLVQGHEFREACIRGDSGLEQISECSHYEVTVVTLERFYIITSLLFRQHIDKELSDRGITPRQWIVLAVEELEKLQPHIAAGFTMKQLLDCLKAETFPATLDHVQTSTGRTYKDSFLYEMDKEIYDRLGVSKL